MDLQVKLHQTLVNNNVSYVTVTGSYKNTIQTQTDKFLKADHVSKTMMFPEKILLSNYEVRNVLNGDAGKPRTNWTNVKRAMYSKQNSIPRN